MHTVQPRAAVALLLLVATSAGLGAQAPAAPGRGGAAAPVDWTRCLADMAGVPAERVRRVPPASSELASLVPVIRRLFGPQEQALRLTGPNLAEAPITIVHAFASTGRGPTEYYFEASKAVRDEATEVPGEEGLLRVVVSGWLRGAGASAASLGTKGDLLWGEIDRPGATDARAELLPLGILRKDGVVVWALKRATPAGGLRFYELGPRRVRPRESAGLAGC